MARNNDDALRNANYLNANISLDIDNENVSLSSSSHFMSFETVTQSSGHVLDDTFSLNENDEIEAIQDDVHSDICSIYDEEEDLNESTNLNDDPNTFNNHENHTAADIENENRNFFENTEKFHDLLDITKSEVMFMIMSYYLRYNLTWNALEGLLSLINSIFGSKVIPNSKYLFKKIFPPSLKPKYHFLCSTCNFYFDPLLLDADTNNQICEVCGNENSFDTSKKNSNFFVTLPLEPQIQNVMKKNNFINSQAVRISSRWTFVQRTKGKQ